MIINPDIQKLVSKESERQAEQEKVKQYEFSCVMARICPVCAYKLRTKFHIFSEGLLLKCNNCKYEYYDV